MHNDETTQDVLTEHGRRRREFVMKSATVAATAPAVSLLLSESAMAAVGPMSGVVNECLDDPYCQEP